MTYPAHYTDIDFALALLFIVLGAIFNLIMVCLIIVFMAYGSKYVQIRNHHAMHPKSSAHSILKEQGLTYDPKDPEAFTNGLTSTGHSHMYGT